MAKDITFSKQAREQLVKGVDMVADAVKCTLGPRGRNALIGNPHGAPQIVNDGVTIAKSIELKDPLQNAAGQLLKEVSGKTNDVAGDGTTTASVLAQAIIHEGMAALENGANPILMKDGIEKAVRDVTEYIKKVSKEVDETSLAQVATVSAGNKEEIGKLIADAIKLVGADGVVTVEESNIIGTNLKTAEGMQLDKGYLSPYFVTNQSRQEAVLEKPYVLCVNKKVNLISDLLPTLETVAREGRSLLLVAEDVEGEALAAMVVNVMRKTLRAAAIKAPWFGDRRKGTLEDIAILTGGQLWTEELGISLEAIGDRFFGMAERVIVRKDETVIVVTEENAEAVKQHIEVLKARLEELDSDYEKEVIKERIAKLTGGVAVIQVGAPTEIELKERKLRIEDALNATKAAQEEGIVAGGGYTLLKAQEACTRNWECADADADYGLGYDIVINALHKPLTQIAENAGMDGNVIKQTCLEKQQGYNALTNRYEDLMESGVIDPAKVTRTALENAASVAGMLLTTEVSIIDEPITEENAGFVPQGPMHMM